jgi:hypothetical protein
MKFILIVFLALGSLTSFAQEDSFFLRNQISSSKKSIEILRKMTLNNQIELKKDLPAACLVIGRAHGRIDAAWEFDAATNNRYRSDLADVAIKGFKVEACYNPQISNVDVVKFIEQLQEIENMLGQLNY